jgi:hypothetical protein
MLTIQAANVLGYDENAYDDDVVTASEYGLGAEVIAPVHPHYTAIVEGGGGFVQHVPFNIPGFGALGALTDDDKNKLAEQVKTASNAFIGGDVRSILAAIPNDADRSDVALKAIQIGGNAAEINRALDSIKSDIEFKKAFNVPMPVRIFWGVASVVSTGIGAYHGYRRNNDSIGWALWWALMGGLFPIVTPAIAFAQGFGKPRRAGFGRARRARHFRRRKEA